MPCCPRTTPSGQQMNCPEETLYSKSPPDRSYIPLHWMSQAVSHYLGDWLYFWALGNKACIFPNATAHIVCICMLLTTGGVLSRFLPRGPWGRFWFSVRDHVIPAAEGERRATQGERLFRASLFDSMHFTESGTIFWRLCVNPLVCHAWTCCALFWTVCGRHERALQPLPGTQTRAALSLRI